MTEAEKRLIDTIKESNIDRNTAIMIIIPSIEKEEYVLAMTEFIKNNPNEDSEVYIDKVIEITNGHTEYYVEGKRV